MPAPSQPQSTAAERRADLSALMDGEVSATDVQRCSALWRDDVDVRTTWHAYHLIGDVLRSDELAASPAHGSAFLNALRLRLADEPTLLAPDPTPAAAPVSDNKVDSSLPARRRQAWLMPAAVAAGFIAVAGVLVVTRLSAPEAAGTAVLASGQPTPSNLQRVGTAPAAGQPLVLNGELIRDAQLDAYLRAHRDMRGSAAAAVPGGAMRSVETIVPQR